MIPIYHAMTLENAAMLGGTTLPCQMRVVDAGGNEKGIYVVKVFNQKDIRQYNPTNKEIIVNLLASEFELTVPKMAIIKVGNTIITKLRSNKVYDRIELKAGYYFGCKYEENCIGYSKNIQLSTYDIWELETIFAFDMFICNRDRRIGKPNILFKDGGFILIDHDLALNIQSAYAEYKSINIYESIAKGVSILNRQHIFFEHLKKLQLKKLITFDDFTESLRMLNISKIKKLIKPLRALDISFQDFDEKIYPHLEKIKEDSNSFKKVLKKVLCD